MYTYPYDLSHVHDLIPTYKTKESPLKAMSLRYVYLIDLMLKTTLAVKKMHDVGFGHFDLKPKNIFMLNKFTIALGDLGLTSSFDKMKTT